MTTCDLRTFLINTQSFDTLGHSEACYLLESLYFHPAPVPTYNTIENDVLDDPFERRT